MKIPIIIEIEIMDVSEDSHDALIDAHRDRALALAQGIIHKKYEEAKAIVRLRRSQKEK